VVSDGGATGYEISPIHASDTIRTISYDRIGAVYKNTEHWSLSHSFQTNGGTTALTLSSAQLVRFNAYGAGTLTTDASGNITATSDITLKILDSYYTKGLSALKDIIPINYYWNKESDLDPETLYTGFSAQNIQENIPEAVGKMVNGKLTLQDRPIMATIINAVKELDTVGGKALYEALIRIKALEAEVKILKNK